ncbi:MAG: PKD domain-containing protein, partial [Saprospiraceae bacterium]|nr:PKD domain-containing protein [Saprospiraceae bacterium]
MRVLFTCLLIFALGFSSNVKAQNFNPDFEQNFFIGCPGECFQLVLNGTEDFQGTYLWTIIPQASQDTMIFTTDFPVLDLCNVEFGPYFIEVTGLGFDGSIPFIHTEEFFFEVLDDFFFIDIFPITPSDCHDAVGIGNVCAGDTVTYSYELQSGTGGFPLFVEWFVEGDYVSYDVSNNTETVTVIWGESGVGVINLLAFTECFTNQEFFTVNIHPIPEPAFNTLPSATDGVLEICAGETVQFENITSNAESYLWDFGNGQTSTDENPSFTFNQSGTFDVSLTAYNQCFCSDITTLTVIVDEGETPLIDCVSTICAGTVSTYSTPNDCGTYLWDISDNGVIVDGGTSSDDFITVEWLDGPEGTLELTLEDCADPTACLATASIQVPIISATAVIDGPAIVCKGDQVTYSVPPYEGTTFNWSVTPFGTILDGQGTNSVTIEWFDGFEPSQTQVVSVSYDNCYLECGGSATLDVNFRPSFLASGPLEVCENGMNTYSAFSSLNNPASANWEVLAADGTSLWTSSGAAADQNIDWIWGSGTFTLIASPDNALDYCTPNYEIQVQVQPTPASADIDGPQSICPGSTYNYQAVNLPQGTRSRWVITNGSAQDTLFGHSINITWGNTPPYELSLVQITNDFLACESPSTDMSLQLIQNFAINGPIDVCLDQIELFTSTYYADLSYEWTISPASAGTITGPLDSNQIEILWHEAGPASISLNVCGQTEAFNVNVLPLPEPVVSHPADLCPNETAVVQTNTNFASYTWFDEGGSVISTVAQPNVGPGYYRVQVEDQNGCVGDTTFYINGYPNPKISITTPFPNGYCGTIPMITLYAVDSEGGYTYQWFRDGNPVGTDSPTFTTNQLGSYYVQVTDQNGCQSISNSIPIYDCCASGNCGGPPSPNPGCTGDLANFDIQNTSECNVHNYLNTSVNPVSGTFNWFFDDPASGADNFSNLDNPSHTFSNPGFYRIIMTGDMVNSSGDVVNCGIWKVDTVEVAADFEFDNACPGEAVAFFDISTYLPVNSIVGWVWDFGDPTSGNNISNMQDPTHTYMNPGTYTVELTVTANTGCTSTIQKDITIFPPPNISFNPPMSSCEDVALQFEAIADPSVTFVKWDFGDGSSGEANESELTPTFHRYETPGTYTVTLFAQSIYGCTNSFTQNITIEPNTLAGDISSTLPSPICEGDLSTLTAPAGAQSWLWSTGATTQSITVGESELYEVTITDADGCEYSPAPFQLDVLPAPEGEIRAYELDEFGQLIAYYYDNYSTCEGEDIFLETQNNTDYSFEWTNGDTEFETEYTDDRGNLLGVGNHDIFVTITDNQTSCSEVIGPLTITINPVPNNVTITADQPGLVCEGTSVTFSVDNPDPSYTYLWSNGSEGATMTTDISGTYFVTAVTPFGCEAESNRLDILDGPNISLVPGGCHYRCEPDTLCVPDIPGVISYQWYLDGNPIAAPEGTVPDLIATQSGSYTLEMTNADGCTLIADPIQLNLFPGFGDITGQVYSDVNNNGVIDAADTVLSNIPVLLNNNLDTIFTSIQGAYGFANIPADDYNLSIDINNLPSYYTVLPVQQDTAITTCDESIQLNFLIQIDCPVIERFENLSFCEGDSVIYNGVTYTSTTNFTNTLSNGFGCDSVVFVNIQELSSSDNTINLSACTGTTVDFNGNTLNPGTTTDFTFVNAVGCDSVVTVQVTELQPSSQMVELTACTGMTVDYNGNTLNPGTSTDFTLTNAAGCDSIVTVVVQELTPTTSMVELSSCTGSTVDYNGNALTPGTSTDFTFVNAAGCDSIVTVMVEELLPSTETIDLFACEGISIDYNGQAIMAGSQEIFQLTNAAGCDSTLTVNVISLQDFNVEVNLSACTGSSANYNGNMLAAGSQTDFVFTSAGGCDSTVTVIVEELVPTTAQIAL